MSDSEPSKPTEPSQTALGLAAAACGVSSSLYFTMGDQGHTLSIDGEGDEDAGGADITKIACVLASLDVSTAVSARMDNTRALDGMQEGAWGDFEASWTYHPDSGFDLIITER